MMLFDPEIQAYRLFETKIKHLCSSNWRFMEYEDRLSEATYIFIIALRVFPTNSGFFWHDYHNSLVIHMQNLKKEYNRQSCWTSLDRYVRDGTNNSCNCTLLDFLTVRESDHTEIHIHRFLNTLPSQHQDILHLLMNGKSRRTVCRRLKMNSVELQEYLQEIGENYRDYSLFYH